MKSKALFITLSTLLVDYFSSTLMAQTMSFGERFEEANRLDAEGELSQSQLLWNQLTTMDPANANVNYKAGRAYLNSYSKRNAALPFFEVAVQGKVTKNYDPISPGEKSVPVEVYYYYAKALHINYQLDAAQENYEKFMTQAPAKHFLWLDADMGRQQVDYAKVLTKTPVDFEIVSLGPVINTIYPEYSPVISVDENAIFFTSNRLRPDSSNATAKDLSTGFYKDDIYASYKDMNGNWQTPELLSINTLESSATINVSVDGQTLYIYKDVNGNGDIFKTTLVGETWSKPVPMSSVINSSAWEPHLAITPDEQTIYFVSDRKGGLGGRDIYRVRKLPDGSWSQAQNLGATINTKYDEDAVFVSPDDKILYFSSEGHTSIGGFDIFYSLVDEEGNWKEPINIGYPINTADDDAFFVTSADGKRAYYSSIRKDGEGEKDIYRISLPAPTEIRVAVLKGKIVPPDGEPMPDDILVYILESGKDKPQVFTPRSRDGAFVAILQPCKNYEIAYERDGRSLGTDTFSIDCESSYQEIYKELILQKNLTGEVGDDVAASAVTGDAQPSEYKKNFGYNKNNIEATEQLFTTFMKSLKPIVERNGKVDITVVGSASKVPTKSLKSNDDLAQIRADEGKASVLAQCVAYGIDPSKINWVNVKGLVQGPEYLNDAIKGLETYKKFQYIELKAK